MSELGIRLIHDRVLIKPDAPQTETESGLLLVKDQYSFDDVPMSGTVMALAIGPRCAVCGAKVRQDVALGDRVVFAPNAGSEVKIDGESYIALAESDILGVVED